MYKPIEFFSQGAILRGRLYIPENIEQIHPVVVMAHGFTSTIIGMTADNYAERFRDAGYAVVLYDHRNLGISDGEPRQEINYWVQARGYIDAIDFISSKKEIDADKIAVWGCRATGRLAFIVGAVDDRVKAILAQVPAFCAELPPKDNDGKLVEYAKQLLLSDTIMDLPHTTTEQMAVVSLDQEKSPSALQEETAYHWFTKYGGREGTRWQNSITISRPVMPEDFHVGQFATHLKAPILMVVAEDDEINGADPEIAREIFKMISQPKQWVDIDGGHFGLLYYPSSNFDKSSQVQIEFLKNKL